MSKYEAEFRIPTRQQYAYINITVHADTATELVSLADDAAVMMAEITASHSLMYDKANERKPEIKASTAPPVFDAHKAITEELGGKVIDEKAKPWERAKPPAPVVPATPVAPKKSLFG